MTASSAPSPRRVVLLGATGSIGRQAQEIVERFPGRFEIVGMVVGHDAAGLVAAMRRLGVRHGAVVAPASGSALDEGVAVGVEAACEIAAMPADVVCVGVSGAAALLPTLAAVDAGREVALATKEVLVMAGELVRDRAARSGARLRPVDSEHSALWQCLRGERPEALSRLVLTASGGPFRDRPLRDFASITLAEALRHPNWAMGEKITVDSATMMNKGLEIIEAHFLFDVAYSQIDVVVHRGSIVHSCVELIDGATIAQLGLPDMRVPIALALSGGERLPGICPPANLGEIGRLDFAPVDGERFPAVALARHAGELGGAAPCVLNAANEAAVAAFIAGRCRFVEIVPAVERTLQAAELPAAPDLDALLALDAWARRQATAALGVGVG